MPIEYINRSKEVYYVRAVETKNGRYRYYIVKDKSKYKPEELLEEIPSGFEFYEHPYEAQVVFRKKLISIIRPNEIEIINDVMREHDTVKDYILDIEVDAIVIYTACEHRNTSYYDDDFFDKYLKYHDQLRFVKTKNKTYQVQRFCHLPDYKDWITIETHHDLAYLAEKYCYHINKESLIEFWIEGEEDW